MNLFIFDWSGVISDDRKPVYEANMRILDDNGIPRMAFDEFLLNTDLTAAEFLAKQGLASTQEELLRLYKKYFDIVISEGTTPQIYTDVKEVLAYLSIKDKILAVLSSHPESNLKQEARNYGIEHYFRCIVGNSRDKSSGIVQIVENIGIAPGKTIYLGDTVYDIIAAKKAGVHSAAISGPNGEQRGYHSRQRLEMEHPDFLLDSLEDLKKPRVSLI